LAGFSLVGESDSVHPTPVKESTTIYRRTSSSGERWGVRQATMTRPVTLKLHAMMRLFDVLPWTKPGKWFGCRPVADLWVSRKS
jgi:hypothetical protein